MPEGPEVATIADALNAEMSGKNAVYLEIGDDLGRYMNEESLEYLKQLLPLKIERVFSKGKQLFFNFRKSSINLYLFCHLKMSGRWTLEEYDIMSIDDITDTKFKIKIGYGDDDCITNIATFTNPRKFGNLEVYDEENFLKKLSMTGPDLLKEDVDFETWSTRIRNKNRWQICKVLKEQSIFSGIGNYLKSEILFHSRIRPDRRVSDITDDELLTLLNFSKSLIKKSYESNGLTIATYWGPTGITGTFEIEIYKQNYWKDKDGKEYEVLASKFTDTQTTYWIPELQH